MESYDFERLSRLYFYTEAFLYASLHAIWVQIWSFVILYVQYTKTAKVQRSTSYICKLEQRYRVHSKQLQMLHMSAQLQYKKVN